MHPLLARQIRRYLGPEATADGPLTEFFEAVDGAYAQFEADRLMLERALDLSSDELMQANAGLQESVSLLQGTFDATGDGIMAVSPSGAITAYNRQFMEMWQVPEELMAAGSGADVLRLVLSQLSRPDAFIQLVRDLAKTPDVVDRRIAGFADGRYFEVHSQPQRLYGKLIGRVWSFHDITELKKAEETIRHFAYHDSLTGLPNRALFNDRIAIALAQARRQGTSVGLFFIDLDQFKAINDSLGHSAGDRLLCEVAARFSRVCRTCDTIARFGGDEFVLLVSNLHTPKNALLVARRLLAELREPFNLDGHLYRVTASVGIAIAPEHAEDAEGLVKKADTALYLAKDLGRNTFQMFRPGTDTKNLERLALETDLRSAIADAETEVAYQPIVDSSGRIVCVEALSRWDRDGAPVSPATFIPVAEDIGVMDDLGALVFEDALRRMSEWHEMGFKHLRVAINVSPKQIQRPGFAAAMINRLREHGLPPTAVELEITETSLMVSADAGLQAVNELALNGFRIALDDFGTGYSSLGQLRSLPLTTLKLDRTFVRSCHTSERDQALIGAMVSLGHTLGLEVVAEGAEEPEQIEFLRSVGCDAIQGYGFSRPVPAHEVTKLLEHGFAPAEGEMIASVAPSVNP